MVAKKAILVRPAVSREDIRLRARVRVDARAPAGTRPHIPPLGGGCTTRVRERSGSEVKNETRNPVDSLLGAAAALGSKDRKELLDRLALQSQIDSAAKQGHPDLDMWSAAVAAALDEAIGAEGGDRYGSGLVRRLLGLSAAWRPIESFMASSGLADETQAVRQAVYALLASLVVAHAREASRRSGAPLGPKLVGNCATNVRGLFECQFPGYLAAGLAGAVARQMRTPLR